MAAQDFDYSFFEKKKEGSFGRKSYKRDEHTQLTHVGSSVTSGALFLLAQWHLLMQKV